MDKEYWKLKKREQRAKDNPVQVAEAQTAKAGLTLPSVARTDGSSPSTGAKPEDVDPKEWELACERAARANKYAEMFPKHVKPKELIFQDPFWQWENEVKGRMQEEKK